MQTYPTAKGQLVIPSSVRRKLGINTGTRIEIDVDEVARKIILTPITRAYIHSLRGKYKDKGLLKALLAEKRRERQQVPRVRAIIAARQSTCEAAS